MLLKFSSIARLCSVRSLVKAFLVSYLTQNFGVINSEHAFLNRTRFLTIRLKSTKTPVQEFGYEYLSRQMNMGRPLSPHLQIYKPQLTWLMSGAHRILATAMSGALLIGTFVFGILSVDYTSFMERLHSWNLWRPVSNSLKFLIAFPIVYHTLNGIRFMGFDMAKGIELPTIYRSGYLVLALSTLISLLIVANSPHLTREQFQQKFKDNKSIGA